MRHPNTSIIISNKFHEDIKLDETILEVVEEGNDDVEVEVVDD